MPQNLWPWNNPNGLRESAQTNITFNADTATAAHVITAANLTGAANDVVLALTGTLAAAATATTDTAANIISAIPQGQFYVGVSYKLRIINESSGAFAWTIAAGAGVTLTGNSEAIAQNTWREYVVTVTSAATVTMRSCGTGTYS